MRIQLDVENGFGKNPVSVCSINQNRLQRGWQVVQLRWLGGDDVVVQIVIKETIGWVTLHNIHKV